MLFGEGAGGGPQNFVFASLYKTLGLGRFSARDHKELLPVKVDNSDLDGPNTRRQSPMLPMHIKASELAFTALCEGDGIAGFLTTCIVPTPLQLLPVFIFLRVVFVLL